MGGGDDDVGLTAVGRAGDLAERLCGVEQEETAAVVRDLAKSPRILHGTGHVGGMGADHQPRRRPPCPHDRVGIDAACSIAGHDREFDHATIREPCEGAEGRVVIGGRGDDVVAGAEQAMDRHVEPERRPRGEGHPLRIDVAEQAGHGGPAPRADRVGLDRLTIGGPAGGGADRSAGMFPRRKHLRRLGPRGGRVVEVAADGLRRVFFTAGWISHAHPPI